MENYEILHEVKEINVSITSLKLKLKEELWELKEMAQKAM
jgi:hypothetical protein